MTPLSSVLARLVDEGGFNLGDGRAFLYGLLQITEDPFLSNAAGKGFDLATARSALAHDAVWLAPLGTLRNGRSR